MLTLFGEQAATAPAKTLVFANTPSAKHFQNLTGRQLDRLTVLGFKGREHKHSYWWCRCECGVITSANTNSLNRGTIKSCGCLKTDRISALNRTHGQSKTPVYRAWAHMLTRCYNPKGNRFQRYGGRGIAVCDRWRESFENFYEDMGDPPSSDHSLDRIDNDKDYSKSNCQWATRAQQMNNTSHNRRITLHGRTQTLTEWCQELGQNYARALARLRLGWNEMDALTAPRGTRSSQLYRSLIYRGK